MGSKFTILFTYVEFLFIGEVRKQLIDRVPVYDVYYALASNPESIDQVEIYRGTAADHGIYWRQRLCQRETVPVDPELVELIGRAIKIQEDIESR
jgi:hypothetical protein